MGIITNIATRIAASAGSTLTRLRFNSWTMGGHGADIFEKSPEALQLERVNPLRGVDEWRLGQIFDDARDGIYADLAWLYNEIEGVEPALVACCDMRESAASECGWLVKTPDAKRTRAFDQSLADEQRVALLAEFGAVEDDLSELAGHLVSAFFRGAAHALPLWNQDGSLAGFRKLDLWNFAFDRKTGIWYWNADASRDEGTFQPIPPGELVSLAVSSSRHVDHAALPIFIRSALGAKRYGVWLDRFGIPPVAVIMPPNAEKGEQPKYMELARKFARGGNGILPNGSAVTYGTEARAVCPFPDFIRFQQEQIYTVGIGRVQSGANDASNLGGNAAGVVEAGFTRLVRRDARRIARAINDTVTCKVLARLFPGKPALAQFAWDTETKRTSREVLEDAGFAKNAGLAIDIDQIQELTGYKLAQAAVPGPGDSGMSLDQLSSLIYPLKAAGYTIQKQQLEKATQLKLDQVQPAQGTTTGGLNAQTPLQNDENRLQNAPHDPDGQGQPPGQPPSQIAKKRPSVTGAESHAETQGGRERGDEVLRAFASDTTPAAKAVQELLKDFSKESCEKFLADLPKLMPDDPVTATVLADAMAEAMASQLSHPSQTSQGEVSNSTDAQGNKHDDGNGQFTEKDGGGAAAKDLSQGQHADVAGSSGDTGSSGEPAEAATYTPATTEAVEKFKAELPKDISPEEFDAILTTGFEDTDGAGNKVKYGTLLRDHINKASRNAEDLGARKRELGSIVRIIRETKPVATSRAGGKERMYAGYIGDKAYVAVADEHNEIGAFIMVSYRRDGKHDKK